MKKNYKTIGLCRKVEIKSITENGFDGAKRIRGDIKFS